MSKRVKARLVQLAIAQLMRQAKQQLNKGKKMKKYKGKNEALLKANKDQQAIEQKVQVLPLGATHVSIDGGAELTLTLRGSNGVALGFVDQSLIDLISHSPVRWV